MWNYASSAQQQLRKYCGLRKKDEKVKGGWDGEKRRCLQQRGVR